MCQHKFQWCGKCCCCKDNVETSLILGLVYIALNAFYFDMIPFALLYGLDDPFLHSFVFNYFMACRLIHPIHYGLLVYGAAKRNSTLILIWIILTMIICCIHALGGTVSNLVETTGYNLFRHT